MEYHEEVAMEYTNGEVTVVWKAYTCEHSGCCWHDLPEVFNPNSRPWVNVMGVATERIIQQVKKCPSGALSYFYNNSQKKAADMGA